MLNTGKIFLEKKPTSIEPVVSDHLSYATIFQCSIGRSYKTGLISTRKNGYNGQDTNDTLKMLIVYFKM
jgi:hypothetical protein